MQRVTNCLLIRDGQVLMLKKPRRGRWSAPGGKMEIGESILESTIREYREETGLELIQPRLKGIFTMVIEEKQGQHEWMLFTFLAGDSGGKQFSASPEGDLSWIPMEDIAELPMIQGDYSIVEHAIYGDGLIYGTFTYGENETLLSYRLEAEGKPIQEYHV
ncbi:NUDIX hydrolase [Salipaludibacillus sp. CF4.18]|uniref:NUDIX hydrolase n=1 Tax=Salipaludibacillus sp. CF4.18 TaxID=3373081 RepID=UPI003EE48FD4